MYGNENDVVRKPLRSLWAYALIGVLAPIPWFGAWAGVIAIAERQRWPEWIAPAVGLLCWLCAGWGSSAVSGWLCGRYLARREGWPSLAAVFLANSSGWSGVPILAIAIADSPNLGQVNADALFPIIAIALFVGSMGLLVTWVSMKAAHMPAPINNAANEQLRGATATKESVADRATRKSEVFLSLLTIIVVVVIILLFSLHTK
jgi:hypothetical protein